jgi:hypothetical protein
VMALARGYVSADRTLASQLRSAGVVYVLKNQRDIEVRQAQLLAAASLVPVLKNGVPRVVEAMETYMSAAQPWVGYWTESDHKRAQTGAVDLIRLAQEMASQGELKL